MKKITTQTTLKKILEIENSEKILQKHNLPCLHCPMAAQEISKLKIGDVSKLYHLDIKNILLDLNTLWNTKSVGKKPTHRKSKNNQ